MSRSVLLTTRAVRDLDALHRAQATLAKRIMAKIQSLPSDPATGKPLVGPLKGIWSLRVGEYRILYKFDDSSVTILTINHRKEVYR